MKNKKLLIGLTILAITFGMVGPHLVRRSIIESSIRDFSVDDAIWQDKQRFLRFKNVDRNYLKKYGIDLDSFYSDRNKPNGVDWMRWSLRTRAATIYLFRDENSQMSAAHVDKLIAQIDSYYSTNSSTEEFLFVLGGITKSTSELK